MEGATEVSGVDLIAGKSSVVSMVMRFYDPLKGQVSASAISTIET